MTAETPSAVTIWLTVKGAAQHVGISTDLVRSAVKRGDLPAYRVGDGGRDYRLKQHEVDDWMSARPYEPQGSS